MRRVLISLTVLALAIAGVVFLQNSSSVSSLVWSVSDQGAWILPLVLVSALLDSVHPCSFSILLITIAFLFSLQLSRRRILGIGGAYIVGIFVAYLLIGFGLLQVLHLFNTPHFMGKVGAALLLAFGALNLLAALFPNFPLKLKLPSVSHSAMSGLMEKVSLPAAFALGLLVGVCQFPCMGGPYLMVIGLLRDNMTYLAGAGYLVLYNLLLIAPLIAVLWFAADTAVLEKLQTWKRENIKGVRFWAGIAMLGLGALVLSL